MAVHKSTRLGVGVAIVCVLSLLMVFTAMAVVLTVSTAAAASEVCEKGGSTLPPSTGGDPKTLGMSEVAYSAYVRAASKSGLDWTYLAAIGQTESNHGTASGSAPNPTTGAIKPPIIGIPIGPDTDNGRYDGDTGADHAVGPMQFIPSTWESYARDGNGDRVKDPHNIFDAAMASAAYLRANGAPRNWKAALFAYNHDSSYVQLVTDRAAEFRKKASAGGVSSGEKVWPVGKDAPLSAHYGQAGSMWSSGYHTGQDFSVPSGTPIHAAASGIVITAGWEGPYGNSTVIRSVMPSGGVVKTRYAHQSVIGVKEGQTVTAGQVIGKVGSTGNSTGAHLHFEVYLNDRLSDPMQWLRGAADTPVGGGDSAYSSVYIEGDSLTVGTMPYLKGAFAGRDFDVDAVEGRTLAQGIKRLDRDPEADAADTWIVALGTNDSPGPAFTQQVNKVKQMAGSRTVVMLTVAGIPAADQINAALRSADTGEGKFTLVDFATQVKANPSYLAADGIHLTPAGYEWRAKLYADTVGSQQVEQTCNSADPSDGGGGELPPPGSSGPFTDNTTYKMRVVGASRSPIQAARWLMGMVGDTGWKSLCLKLADDAYGGGNRLGRAIDQWYRAKRVGYAHPNDRNPPVGAQLFWWSNNDARHVATYVGGGKVVSNMSDGSVQLQPASYFDSYGPYLGWAEPYYGGG